MKRFTILVLTLFLFAICSAQTITLDENRYEGDITLNGPDKQQVTVGIAMSYDSWNGSIVIDLTPKSTQYNWLWLPDRKTTKQEIKEATKSKLNGRSWRKRPFRKSNPDGVAPAFELRNAIVLHHPESPMLKSGEKARYEFLVVKQEKPVAIRIACAVPVSEKKSIFGKRFVYQFAAASEEMNITLRIDPCKKKENVELLKELSEVVKDADTHYDNLVQSSNKKNFKECKSEKEYIVTKVQPQYESWKQKTAAQETGCTEIQVEMDTWADIMSRAENAKCHGGSTGTGQPSECEKAAKTIKSNTKELETCLNNLRSKKNVADSKRQGEDIIRRTEALINKTSTKNCPSDECKAFQSECNSFNSTKKAFQINAKRK